ncbi:histidinol phosphatase [Mucilaginibacter sp. JRF]|uniref:tyrosine-protein phosphatase n=1 Tax=Mucilaginibacter sp. JRF TaxID=2780088 RepID=UPI0018826CD4|nr:CpsB/CapC family capsule biosynthesis tyrosine phosphatase [Mucilaginibacter sp. JRF]MBE9585374.1 histidinol phosphatase [Mucilaginibacter sp. JRF]
MFSFFKKSLPDVRFDWLGTDIHSHLLPGIDDGSPDLESSISYITSLHNLGFNKFICTPHIFMDVHPNNRDTITTALNKVLAADTIKKLGVNVSAAAEYMVDSDFGPLTKEEGGLMEMPGKYVLIEMSYLSETPDIENYVFELNVQGYKPILAHPERYNFYHGKPEKIHRFKDMGCLLQLNLLSVTGYYGREVKHTALRLLKDGVYSLAGTDFHHDKHLKGFQDARLWKDVYDQVKNYEFRNRELFGV